MNTYTVTYDDGNVCVVRDLPRPDRFAQPGDIYEFTNIVYTLGGDYYLGDQLEIMSRTDQAPFYRKSSLGNLLVKCKHHTSVWSELDASIALGQLKLVKTLTLDTNKET